jgi:hypothetical protein
MEHNPRFEALDALHREQAEIREQIRVSDDLLAKSPLRP